MAEELRDLEVGGALMCEEQSVASRFEDPTTDFPAPTGWLSLDPDWVISS